MKEVTITVNNFEEEVIKSNKPVLVDFWASWCGPCKMLAPTIAEIAEENDDIKVGKINVDDEPALARKFMIMSIPTLLVFKDGEIVNKGIGLMPKDSVLALIK